MDALLGPQIDLGRIARAPMPAWLVDVANAALKLSDDEVLVISMPRQSAHPVWSAVQK
jgi:hypothetical protein